MLTQTSQSLNRWGLVAYASGMMGWSILINLISVILVYLYLPPQTSGLPSLITQVVIFGFFNVIALITASGRLLDAIYDPLIAQWSDRSKHPKGRRIPIMKLAVLPSVVFCFLVFYPLNNYQSNSNIVWLVVCLALFYISSTSYIIPYNALLPELAGDSAAKVKLSTWQSFGYVMGIGISANTFSLAEFIQHQLTGLTKLQSLQTAVLIMCLLGGIAMLVTVLVIDEKKYCHGVPSSVSLVAALKQTLNNRNFILFTVADFSYFMAVTIITSGLMYFVTVLLPLQETEGNKLMITMVLVSFLFYPLTGSFAKKFGKKAVVLFSFGLLAIIFSGIAFLGTVEINAKVQIYTLIAFASIPLATLNILPNAILAEIIETDSLGTGQNKEAIYFAVRYFFVKIAQTFGMAIFAMLLINGKDVGNDLGIRLNGVFGFVLCLLALLIFSRFKEELKADAGTSKD